MKLAEFATPKPSRAEHTAQLNVRVPTKLRDDFYAACRAQGVLPSDALRALMQFLVTTQAQPESSHE